MDDTQKKLNRLISDFGKDTDFLGAISWTGDNAVLSKIRGGKPIPKELFFSILQAIPADMSRDFVQAWWADQLSPDSHCLWKITPTDTQKEPYQGTLQWYAKIPPEQQDAIRDAINLAVSHPQTNSAIRAYIELIIHELEKHTRPPF